MSTLVAQTIVPFVFAIASVEAFGANASIVLDSTVTSGSILAYRASRFTKIDQFIAPFALVSLRTLATKGYVTSAINEWCTCGAVLAVTSITDGLFHITLFALEALVAKALELVYFVAGAFAVQARVVQTWVGWNVTDGSSVGGPANTFGLLSAERFIAVEGAIFIASLTSIDFLAIFSRKSRSTFAFKRINTVHTFASVLTW